MKRFEIDKYGQLAPVPDGQEPRDKRWTVRAVFIYLSGLVVLAVFIYAFWARYAA